MAILLLLFMKMVVYTSLMSVIKQVLLKATYDTSDKSYATISADGNTAFVTDWSQGIQIIDIAESFANGDASVATSHLLTGSLDTSEWSYGLTISADGDTAFVADGAGVFRLLMLVIKQAHLLLDLSTPQSLLKG